MQKLNLPFSAGWLFIAAIVANGCGSSIGNFPPTASSGGKPENKCVAVKGKDTLCNRFYWTDDPFKDPKSSPEQKIAYAKMGYQCAANRGLVAISPRFNLPAIDCPWIRESDATPDVVPTETQMAIYSSAVYPAPIASAVFPQPDKFPTHGYLLTAYDTPRGVRYVIIEAERDFAPSASLLDVEKDFNSLVTSLRELNGKNVIYLTNYPLINARENDVSRVLRDAEIEGLKMAVKNRGDEIQFVNWQ